MKSNGEVHEPGDPAKVAVRASQPSFPKRFYTAVGTQVRDGGVGLTLDGRGARTPARNPFVLPTQAVADAIVEEWEAVEAEIDPRRMPFTRLANSIIDGVVKNAAEVKAEILRYAASDLIVYRADEPAELVDAQRAAWDPLLAWSRTVLGASLVLGSGITFVHQPAATLDGFRRTLDDIVGADAASAFRLGAIHVMTTLTGSAILAIAVAAGRLSPAEAWTAAHVDEDFQIAQWGQDEEAALRRQSRWVDMNTAGTLAALVGGPRSSSGS